MASDYPHYFIGIPIEKQYEHWLGEWQTELKEKDLKYKSWTHPADLHITLKFLGAVSDKDIKELKDNLAENFRYQSFQVNIGNIGFFGKQNNPRVIWAGVENNDLLNKLQENVENVCISLGFTKESRPYRPHITLAKKAKTDNRFDQNLLLSFQERKEMTVSRFCIFRIHPSSSPKYEVVKEIILK
ncbi:RNA 2',3'-cyclic phosphodiesterase [Sediminibacillus massiliensis]|uniref:RNA 2',3'-cyclic phosphodiesterase n=1 Tax=Sediminibacillus massiliensis TaxID=1926277 RepID=UPI00098848AD|nr:RNA 2',3'-cyclic phosphodiesterase [Sediminibacillus massiliensis]